MDDINPVREIVCYPITNISRPLDMFGAFPKELKTFVPIALSPPPPPCRNSSMASSTLKIFSKLQSSSSSTQKIERPTQFRSKSAGSYSSLSMIKDAKNMSNSSTKVLVKKPTPKVISLAAPKRSPRYSHSPVAFGRSISRERTFAEEKKRIEESLPQCGKIKNLTTRILRKADLKSPDEVKRAIQNTVRYGNVIERVNNLSKKCDTNVKRLKVTGNDGNNKVHSRVIMNWVTRGQNALGMGKIRASRSKTIKSVEDPKMKTAKALMRSKTASTSNVSLARTNSTFSISSTKSKRKEPVSKRSDLIGSTYISTSSSSRTKTEPKTLKEIVDAKNRLVKFDCHNQNTVHKSYTPQSSAQYFQDVCLRNYSSEVKRIPTARTVLEKARIWNQISAKSEPNLRPLQVYLSAKRPVSSSKFKLIDYARNRPRSLSPRRPLLPSYICHSSKFDSFAQLSQEEDEFGNTEVTRNFYSYQERSRSEPPTITVLTEIVKPDSPVVIHGRKRLADAERESRSMSPARLMTRSQLCPRIETQHSQSKVVNRTRSLSSPHSKQVGSRLTKVNSQSTKSLDVSDKSHQKSERFRELNQFYSNLERIGQLERATSQSDLKPIRKQKEIIDFELWKRIRSHEKAEKELNYLIGKLKKEQKEKGLFFKSHDLEDIRWEPNRECGLRIKEKSVEDLKELFLQKSSDLDDSKREEIEMNKDRYRSLWKGSSVMDVASSMVNKYQNSEASSTKAASPQPEHFFGLSRSLISTLSSDQISKLKVQLKAIYSGEKALNKGVTLPKAKTITSPIRSASLPKDTTAVVLRRPKESYSKPAPAMSETEKKRLSQDFCLEIKNVFEQKKNRTVSQKSSPTRSVTAAIRSQSENVYNPTPVKDLIDFKGDEECGSSEATAITVIHRPIDNIQDKIQYFEDKNTEVAGTTIYHARDYSSPDEEEIMAAINLKMQNKKRQENQLSSSQSFSDLKEMFGEKSSMVTQYSRVDRSVSPLSGPKSLDIVSEIRELSESHGQGKVRKLTTNFEVKNLKVPARMSSAPARTHSNPDIFQTFPRTKHSSITRVRNHELGDVTWMTHKFETKDMANRSRCRTRRVVSPTSKVSFKKDNRYMPHIDIISKTASLKRDIKKSGPVLAIDRTGEVDKIREMFENRNRLSILGKMYTSVPDITELREVCRYLSGPWFAHRFPDPGDNKRSLSTPEKTGPVVEIVQGHQSGRNTRHNQTQMGQSLYRDGFVANTKTENIEVYRENKGGYKWYLRHNNFKCYRSEAVN